MKIKHLLISFLIIAISFFMIFVSGCAFIDMIDKIVEKPSSVPLEVSPEVKEAITSAGEEIRAEEEIKEEKTKEEDLIEGFEEQEELFPDETIKYHTQLTGAIYEHLEGLEFILEVNFKTQKVEATGVGGKDNKSLRASGKIEDMENLKVYVHVGDWEFVDAIMGTISEDLSTIDGAVLSQSINYKFTATR